MEHVTNDLRLVERIRNLQPGDQSALPIAPSTKCPLCGDTTWEPVVIDGVKRVRKCTGCVAAAGGDAPGIPVDAKGITLARYGTNLVSDPSNQDARRHGQLFVDGVHQGLYIWGGVGTGKSVLAAAILNTLRQTVGAKPGRFMRCTELMQTLLGQFDDDHDRREEAVSLQAALVAVPVLVLDDVGAQKGSEFSQRTLQDLFDRRIDLGHRTIWTSNYDLDALADHLKGDERLVSRIAGSCKVVELDGVDYRMERAKARSR